MNALRLRFGGADDKAIAVRSTIDRSWHLAPKTDEQIQFARDDLVNIKNVSEHRVLLRISLIRSEDGGIVIRSSRRGAFYVSEQGEKLWFQPGEVLNVRSARAQDPRGAGAAVAV